MRRRVAFGIVCGLSVVCASLGHAQDAQAPTANEANTATATDPDTDADDEARMRFELGNNLYEQGRFDEALVEFRRAHELSGRPGLLYNIYLTQRDAGHTANAARVLRRYLEEVEDAPNRSMLEQRLAALEAQVERDLEAERRSAEADLLARQVEEVSDRSFTGPLAVLGAGLGVLVAGASLGIANLRLHSDLEDRCYVGSCRLADQDDIDALDRRNLTADILVGVGGAMTLASVIWLIIEATRGVRTPHTISLDCGPGRCELRGSF